MMDEEMILGMIIMCAVSFGCGALFYGIGRHMQRSKKPAHFWAGSEVTAEWVTDIAAYNLENGRMWKFYSLPYFLAGILACLVWFHIGFMIAALFALVAAAFPGIWLLIRQYRKIEEKYINAKTLDKKIPFC